MCPHGKIYTKNSNFDDYEGLSQHFYTYNVEMWLKGTDLGILQPHKILQESLKGYCKSCGYCIALGVMHLISR